jgi:quinol-cytochrome oxidoreductase complex cytochrome b subunit
MAGLVLVIMMLSGSFLAMHYVADTRYAFATVIEITENVKYGWLMRYIHANGASVFFIILYLHILKALFFGSYAGTR